MSALRYQLDGLRKAWDNGYRYEVWRTSLAFVILYFIAFGGSVALPELRGIIMGYIQEMFGSMNLSNDAGQISALLLFTNNVQACCIMMFYGLIPFLKFTAFPLGVNAMLLGVMLGHYMANGMSLPLYLASLLPHAIFELPALVLALAMGLFVCGQLTRRCRHDETALPVWDCLVNMSRTLLLVTPLLIAAAVTEAHITPMIASLFQ